MDQDKRLEKFKIEKKELIEVLNTGGSMSGKSKTGLSILQYSKVSINKKQIVVTSSDVNTFITKRLHINDGPEEKCEFCVSSNDITRALKTLSDKEVFISIEEEQFKIEHESGVMEFPVTSSSDFPEPTKSENIFSFSINSAVIGELINIAKDFTANDSFRPILAGINLCIDGNKMECAASDGNNLFFDEYKIEGNSEEPVSVTIPSHSCKQLLNAIYKEEVVEVSINKVNVVFSAKDTRFTTSKIDGRYPNFHSIIPKDNNIEINVDRNLLLQKIQRLSLFGDSTKKVISLEVKEKKMQIKAQSIETRKKGKEFIEVINDNKEEIEIGFRSDYIITALNAISGDLVKIFMSTPYRAVVFKDTERPNMIILSMPLLIE